MTYNGWKNHATWAIHTIMIHDRETKELFDSHAEFWKRHPTTSEAWTQEQSARFNLADWIKEWYDELLDSLFAHYDSHNIAHNLVQSVVPRGDGVDWTAIAKSFLEHVEEVEQHEAKATD